MITTTLTHLFPLSYKKRFVFRPIRSHLYDGCTLVIEGGPGTGKTTTSIQRLKFLLSKEALSEYDNKLTQQQIEYLTDPIEWNHRWLFFSPTELLLEYLRNNMREEELIADDQNTRTLNRFRKVKMREYGLFDPTKDGPFKDYKTVEDERTLILEPKETIRSFEQFCISFIKKAFDKQTAIATNDYDWHHYALRIKATYRDAKIDDVASLIRLLQNLNEQERDIVAEIDSKLKDALSHEAVKIKNAIQNDEEATNNVKDLFEQWSKEQIQPAEDVENELTLTDLDELDLQNPSNSQEFETKLYTNIRNLLRKIGLKQIDGKTKLTPRDESFKKLIEKFITANDNIRKIGEQAWFNKNFASMCRGAEIVFIRQLPRIYKAFRKQNLVDKLNNYQLTLLNKIITKDKNKNLHPDEQNLLLGFINNTLYTIYRNSRTLFNGLKSKYVEAYKGSVRPVIGIDEATDYSLLDYYCMASFKHYEFYSITLCGDIMQGLKPNGINKWTELKGFIFPKIDIVSLETSYRQIPTLLDLSREMYKDDQKKYPSYSSHFKKSDDEPKPLLLISDDEEEKAIWISKRIIEIYKIYKNLPSIAIFVGDDIDIPQFIERIEELDMLNGIEVVDCSGGKKLDSKEVVRIFRLSEVKGMEFEAVFFYDIDTAVTNVSKKLMPHPKFGVTL